MNIIFIIIPLVLLFKIIFIDKIHIDLKSFFKKRLQEER